MDIQSMFSSFSILTTAIGAGLLYFGLKWYGTSLSISFFVPSFMILNMFGLIDRYPTYTLGPLIGISILILFFSRPLTYLIGWFFIFGSLCLPMLYIIEWIYEINKLIVGVYFAISIIVVWFIRTHLRAINIGLAGGACISMGTLIFLFPNFVEIIIGLPTQEILKEETSIAIGMFPMLWMVAWMIGGIVFQFLYIIPRKEKISDEPPSNVNVEVNVSTSPSDSSPKPDDSKVLSDDHSPSDDEKSEDTDISQDESDKEDKEHDESSKK
jgi:hypothetical protein